MKNFSIRKLANPNQSRGTSSAAFTADDAQRFGASGGAGQDARAQQYANGGQPSLLTEEEQEALKPKEVQVENPWIYEQTHQEYLDNIKVSIVFQVFVRSLIEALDCWCWCVYSENHVRNSIF